MTSRAQQLAFALVSLGAVGAFAALAVAHRAIFEPFLGPLHPLLVVAAAAVLGGVAARLLVAHGFAVIDAPRTRHGILVAAVLATLFGAVVVAADTFLVRYPRDINVPWPQAVLFYPAMGYLVEVGFHLLPLAVLVAGRALLRQRLGDRRFVTLCVVLPALIEPTFQLLLEPQPRPFTWAHVFAFNVAQLVLFARYDFVSMACLRLFYYAYWHILWGGVRLHLLF